MSHAHETDEARFHRVAAIFHSAGFLATLGIRLDEVGPGWCETSLDITDAHRQQHGYVHAGVVTTLADHTAGGAGRAVGGGQRVGGLRGDRRRPRAHRQARLTLAVLDERPFARPA